MNTYQHTQRGKYILAAMLLSALVAIGAGFVSRPAFIIVPILLVCGWLFHSLTIEVTDGELRWRFGPGWIRKRVPLELIEFSRPVKTNFLEGWGIHLSRFGWLYNVSGFDAVAIKMKNGQHFALGTDEPEALCRALQRTAPGPKAPEPAVRF